MRRIRAFWILVLLMGQTRFSVLADPPRQPKRYDAPVRRVQATASEMSTPSRAGAYFLATTDGHAYSTHSYISGQPVN